MTSTTFSFYSWVKQIPGDLLQLDEVPLLGFPPAFSWEEFTTQLSKTLQLESLKIESGEWQWRSQNELFAGMGDKLQALRLNINPLSGNVTWVMAEKELAKLLSLLVTKNGDSFGEIDGELTASFYRFVAVEVINTFEKVDFDKKLSPVLLSDTSLPAETSLCLDISITLQDQTVWGRLFLSSDFRASWKQRYLARQEDFALKSPMAEKLQVIVHIEGGKTQLKKSDWKKIKLGDVLVLDSCSLDVGEDKGRVMLTINGAPFFRAKVKQGSIKILEHPLYHEVDTPMNKNSPEDEDEHDEESEIETEDEDLDFDDLDEEIDEEMESEIEEETEHGEDEEFSEFQEEEEKKPSKSESPKTESTPPKSPSAEATTVKITASQQKPPALASVEEIPMPIVVEVGRIQLSVKQLMEMQPGNMLELNIHPENGVDLVVNGTRIARGELLRIGEVLGIRVLELT